MWFKSKGTIRYDPPRDGLSPVDRNGRTSRDKWWAIVQVDSEICRYYRQQVMKHLLNPLGFEKRKDAIRHGFHFIDLPSWGPHCSVIRGERPRDHLMDLWKKYDRMEVEFEYSHEVKHQNDYYFVLVRSEFLTNMRNELEIASTWPFHITVGRIWKD